MRILPLLLFSPLLSFSQSSYSLWDNEKLDIKDGSSNHILLSADKIFEGGWNELAQPLFWKKIMRLSPDSCIVNIAKDRTIVAVMSNRDWNAKSDIQKDAFRDSVRLSRGLSSEDRIFVTTGKNDFYKFDLVYPTIARGIEAFEQNNVDPWYAQAILLIESPGQLKKSSAGAYGPFQLMPAVARNQGLVVNSYQDDRKDFDKSAFGASQLLKRICIPEAKRILEKNGIPYAETDLWFRLYVLHVYHAGALNVDAVTAKIGAKEGNELIRQMWINTAANFGNNSQNYTQLALASQLILHEMIYERCDYIFSCISSL